MANPTPKRSMMKALKTIFVFVAAIGASVVVGWWFSQRRQAQPQALPATPQPVVPPPPIPKIVLPPEAFADISPEIEPEAHPAPVDDLTVIRGIGPKTQAALAEMGIVTFAELAAADVKGLKARLDEHGTFVAIKNLENWIVAAKERA